MQFAFACNAKRFAIVILVCFFFFSSSLLDGLPKVFYGCFVICYPESVTKVGLISFDTLKKFP